MKGLGDVLALAPREEAGWAGQTRELIASGVPLNLPLAIPVVEDMPGGIPSMYAQTTGSLDVGGIATSASAEVGAGHSTHLWMAGVMLIALGLIIFLHVSGFRFAGDVGVLRG